MNKRFKLVSIMAVFAFGFANAQETPVPAPAPAPVAPAQVPAQAPATVTPASAPAPAAQAPAAPTPAPAPAAPAPVAAPPVAAPAPAPEAVQAPVAAETPAPAPEAPVAAQPDSAAAPVAQAPAPQTTQTTDSNVTVLVVKEPKKKRRASKELTIVDVPANFEIQARKVMPIETSNWGTNNLDTWWGRANLMVLTESENFIGKIHLRMYPDGYKGNPSVNGNDYFQLYEAWAWHRGDYVNVKLGRWDNTTRFGSKTFGGYIDAKKDKDISGDDTNRNRRASGFMSTYDPENAVQFGLNNFSENVSLDIALISSDKNLNKGDLRIYFQFKELAGLENMNIGIGYRSNVFDEIYSRYGDVTHTVDLAVSMPLVENIGILKNLNLFAETAFIGLDDQDGRADSERRDVGGISNKNNPAFPILAGLDISLYKGLDKVVVEAEFDGNRRKEGGKKGQFVQSSIYLQKKLNDRFTLNLGAQSENNNKDFSFAGRLQGRIN